MGGMIRAVVFDFDGVIADTEPLHLRAANAALASNGALVAHAARTERDVAVSEAEFYGRLMGLSDAAFFERVLTERGLTAGDGVVAGLLAAKNAAYVAIAEREVRPLPGVVEFVRAAAARGPTAVCSGARRVEIEMLLGRFGIADCIRTVVGIEDAGVSKPDPTGYRMTLARLRGMGWANLAAGECLVIEDSVHGVAAAKAAGMRVLAVRTQARAKEPVGADAVVAGLAGLTVAVAVGLVGE